MSPKIHLHSMVKSPRSRQHELIPFRVLQDGHHAPRLRLGGLGEHDPLGAEFLVRFLHVVALQRQAREGSDPVLVSGRLSFVALTAGEYHTCALTAEGAAYCWGRNTRGQLGDGSSTNTTVPVAVTGGLTFSSLSAGKAHTCGVTTTLIVYCWGANSFGQLGNGAAAIGIASNVPVKVAGQP